MKSVLIIYVILLLTNQAYSQEPDKALVKVQYAFTHIRDTADKGNPYSEIMLLFTGKNASMYISYDKLAQKMQLLKEVMEAIKTAAPGQRHIRAKSSVNIRETSPNEYYLFPAERKLFTKEQIDFRYIVEDEFPVMDWQILKDTLSFSGIHCQKAVTMFKGRKWIAWFAPEMPFQSGPWKLNGLPGLIIEAYDDKEQVQFRFGGIEKITEDTKPDKEIPGGDITQIILPVNDGGALSRVTRKEFDKLKAAHEKDPQGFSDAEWAARGLNSSNTTFVGTDRSKYTPPPGPVINNPIELSR